MKKSFLSFVFSLLFLFCSVCSFAEKQDYKIVYVELPWGQTTLLSTFYCFNELQTGRELAASLYNVKDLDKILKAGRFKKLMPVPPGSEISAYNFAIMTHNQEFWFFENRDDGWLWGTGRY